MIGDKIGDRVCRFCRHATFPDGDPLAEGGECDRRSEDFRRTW